MRTTLNVTGDSVVCAAVAKLSNYDDTSESSSGGEEADMKEIMESEEDEVPAAYEEHAAANASEAHSIQA